MQDVVIYGAGGFGRETALLIDQINSKERKWKMLGFCDDSIPAGNVVDDLPVLGGQQFLLEYKNPVAVILAIANNDVRKRIASELAKSTMLDFPALLHPSVIDGGRLRNSIGNGTIISANCILTTNVNLGKFVIINLACTLGHDITIGTFTSVMPSCSISGNVSIGDEVLIGTGARILPNLTIGTRSIIGAGAVVIEDVAPETKVAGVPAKPIR